MRVQCPKGAARCAPVACNTSLPARGGVDASRVVARMRARGTDKAGFLHPEIPCVPCCEGIVAQGSTVEAVAKLGRRRFSRRIHAKTSPRRHGQRMGARRALAPGWWRHLRGNVGAVAVVATTRGWPHDR